MSEQTIWARLRAAGMTEAGVAGLMGNMSAESSMRENNLQDAYESSFGMSDAEYTSAVDNGTYTRFAADKGGYGLCQWTLASRKAKLLAFARARGVSIGDEDMQVDFCIAELREAEYSKVLHTLCTTNSVYEAADIVCRVYERPADCNVGYRAARGQEFLSRFAGTENIPVTPPICSEPADVAEPVYDVPAATRFANMSQLSIGVDGTQLDALRFILAAKGYDVSPHGVFEETFKDVVVQFQRDYGLVADGIVGKMTWAALLGG